MQSITVHVICWLVSALATAALAERGSCCNVSFDVTAEELYRTWPIHHIRSSVESFQVFVELDLPDGKDNTIDMLWQYGTQKGRLTASGDLVFRRKGDSSSLDISFMPGFGNSNGTSVRVALCSNISTPNCTIVNNSIQKHITSTRVKRSGTREKPVWVDLDEVSSAVFAWVWPIKSRYGIDTLALASGSVIGETHEYIQLSSYERFTNGLFVPGIGLAGPIGNWGAEFGQGRFLFRYSKRDACWVLWNYETGRPAWANMGSGISYWRERTCAVPVYQPGLVFDHSES